MSWKKRSRSIARTDGEAWLDRLGAGKVSYTRTEQEALAKLRYDLYYIEHRYIKIDIVIILKTVLEVLLYHGT